METNKVQIYEKTSHPKHREFINSQNNCVLCGSALDLRHISDKTSGSIKEEAHCPRCEVKTRTKLYSVN